MLNVWYIQLKVASCILGETEAIKVLGPPGAADI